MTSIKRLIDLPLKKSFFLFGPRGSGKSTLLDQWRPQDSWFLDLLDPALEEKYILNPGLLRQEIDQAQKLPSWIIIDEVQKIPALLDVAHWAIQKKKVCFALTGSSARKLKRGKANLLAGRALDLRLHPFTLHELGKEFDLNRVLRFGSLPETLHLESDKEREQFLVAYTRTYLKEEIQVEQIVRNVQRFRKFLAFAGQMNTKILNFSKTAAASGIDEKSINRYFEILEDTLLGFFLEPFDKSVRVRQKQKPKFYLFDTGIACQLREDFSGVLKESSSLYGELFEQWFILECHRLNDYLETQDNFFYLCTKDDAEIDLIIQRRGQKPILIEIKSTNRVTDEHTRHLESLMKDIGHSRAVVVSRESKARGMPNGIEILPYEQALRELYPV